MYIIYFLLYPDLLSCNSADNRVWLWGEEGGGGVTMELLGHHCRKTNIRGGFRK